MSEYSNDVDVKERFPLLGISGFFAIVSWGLLFFFGILKDDPLVVKMMLIPAPVVVSVSFLVTLASIAGKWKYSTFQSVVNLNFQSVVAYLSVVLLYFYYNTASAIAAFVVYLLVMIFRLCRIRKT